MKTLWAWLKRLRCVLGHRWDWKEIGPGLEFARRVLHGPPFRCLRCDTPWRHGG
jgi:hypothetical protein